jgi:LmbE family N-acetylglucosaminyl deacetylase
MMHLLFSRSKDEPLSVLFLGAHSDDIEIGCGGTITRLVKEYPNLSAYWVVFAAEGVRESEARNSAEEYLAGVANKKIVILSHRDGYLPYHGEEVKDFFEQLKNQVTPDLIFTQYRDDLHQDHRQICELTWNTFRNHLILEYEIPKYDGDLGQPNFFVQLDETACQTKVDRLQRHFQTQAGRYWFTDDTFYSLMRIRGVEARSSTGFAEGFYLRKGVY